MNFWTKFKTLLKGYIKKKLQSICYSIVFKKRFLKYFVFSLICIYCEKTFKDRTVLKEHMRKKFHKCINPNNKMYDKFYMINYLEPGRTWKQRQV